MKLETTLQEIENIDPCWNVLGKLLEGLGQDLNNPDLSKKVSLKFILENNGLYDALWALRLFTDIDDECARYALFCANRVRHLMLDCRSISSLDWVERFLSVDDISRFDNGFVWRAMRACLDAKHDGDSHYNAASSAYFACCSVFSQVYIADTAEKALRAVCYDETESDALKKELLNMIKNVEANKERKWK